MEIIKINSILDEAKPIIDKYSKAKEKRKDFELGFNVFSLVSDTYYRENFHSEIIWALLNPEGKHGKGRLFLDLFLEFLKEEFKIEQNDESYKIAKVENEFSIGGHRRIDLLIYSESHAIIIENKINNAIDMPNQLVDYYKHCKNNKNNKLEVDAILYLSLDGNKMPDKNKWDEKDKDYFEEIDKKLKPIAAFSINQKNTIYSWLEKCHEQEAKEIDTKFIIRQYQQLLKSLRGYIMETDALKEYYDFISKNKDKVEQIENLVEMHKNLVCYYPEKLMDAINFSQSRIFDNTTVIFDNIMKDNNYFLAVSFIDYKKCVIQIKSLGNWNYDDQFKENQEYKKLFEEEDNFWSFRESNYDLIHGFQKLIDDIKKILEIVSKIIDPKKMSL